MSEKLKITGERVVIGTAQDRTEQDHLSRYNFVTRYTNGKRVLDLACGTGYGSRIIADGGATEVCGVDISKETVNYAEEHYSAPNIKFFTQSAEALSFEDSYFDVIVSFETIEHLPDEVRTSYLSELFRTLKDDGLVIISTPNKQITSPWTSKPLNPYHVLEYRFSEFKNELEQNNFSIIGIYGQRMIRKFLTMYVVRKMVRVVEKLLQRDFHIYDVADNSEVKEILSGFEARYFVVVCKKQMI